MLGVMWRTLSAELKLEIYLWEFYPRPCYQHMKSRGLQGRIAVETALVVNPVLSKCVHRMLCFKPDTSTASGRLMAQKWWWRFDEITHKELGLSEFHVVGQSWTCFLSPDLGRRPWGVWSPCKTIKGLADVRRNCSQNGHSVTAETGDRGLKTSSYPLATSCCSMVTGERFSQWLWCMWSLCVRWTCEIGPENLKADYSEHHFTVITSEVCILLGRLVGQ